MSLDTVGTQGYQNANPPSGDFSVMFWYRAESDPAGAYNLAGCGTNTASERTVIGVSPAEAVLGFHNGSFTASLVTEDYTSVWRYCLLTYDDEDGGSDGVLTAKYLDDGDSAFQATQSASSLSDATRSAMLINTAVSGSFSLGGDVVLAFVKYVTGVISDANALTERQYRLNQTGNEHATYAFKSDALTTDESSNGYTLSGVGSGGAYTGDEPSAILGDNPPSDPEVVRAASFRSPFPHLARRVKTEWERKGLIYLPHNPLAPA